MPDWLQDALHNGHEVSAKLVLARLAIALALGMVVAGIYVISQRKQRTELFPLATTLVLLTILIAMVTVVIGNNVARAFSLAGALAIIRFRTVVEDTRDTAFVIFAVVVGMSIGAGFIAIALVGTPMVALAAVLLSLLGRAAAPATGGDFSLAVRLGIGRDPSALLRTVFDKHLALMRLRQTTTARQGAALDLTYTVRLRREDEAVAFVSELNQIEGVQNVELRQL
jgi:uncharacterized membrane protein YhiD involved in acid resistance